MKNRFYHFWSLLTLFSLLKLCKTHLKVVQELLLIILVMPLKVLYLS